jgi:mRNA-degrading endonuclease toxin of MazEF toxin-antitoxin module
MDNLIILNNVAIPSELLVATDKAVQQGSEQGGVRPVITVSRDVIIAC